MLLRNYLTICFVFLFSVCYAQLQLVSPTGIENYTNKSIIPLVWEPGAKTDAVKIEYYNRQFSNLIEFSTPNDGQYVLDMHSLGLNTATISIKITDVDNPSNYTITKPISINECQIYVQIDIPRNNLCVGQPVTYLNNTTNATTYQWYLNEQKASTAKDFVHTPQNLDDFEIRLEAFNNNCYDYTEFDVTNKPSFSDDSQCSSETVIEEMMITENGEIARMTASIPVVIADTVKALAVRITHDLEGSKQYMNWDWSTNSLPGFNLKNIDHSQKDKVTVFWTSPNPEGTSIAGELYALVYEIYPLADDPVIVTEGEAETPIITKPAKAGETNLSYKSVTSNSKLGTMTFVRTSGVIITKDDIIILEQ